MVGFLMAWQGDRYNAMVAPPMVPPSAVSSLAGPGWSPGRPGKATLGPTMVPTKPHDGAPVPTKPHDGTGIRQTV